MNGNGTTTPKAPKKTIRAKKKGSGGGSAASAGGPGKKSAAAPAPPVEKSEEEKRHEKEEKEKKEKKEREEAAKMQRQAESMRFPAGWVNEITFDMTPRMTIEKFDEPSAAIKSAIKSQNPSSLVLHFPVSGQCSNFDHLDSEAQRYECFFCWLVERQRPGTETPEPAEQYPLVLGPGTKAEMVVQPNGRFTVELRQEPPPPEKEAKKGKAKAPAAGASPPAAGPPPAAAGTPTAGTSSDKKPAAKTGPLELDMIAAHLVGKGRLGFSVTPNIKHAPTATFAPSLEFDHPLEVQITPVREQPILGQRVTFGIKGADLFNKVLLELKVRETDEEAAEAPYSVGQATPAFEHSWEAGASRGGREWAIGFCDSGYARLADVGKEEMGAFEFGWELRGKVPETAKKGSLLGAESTTLLSNPIAFRVGKISLQSFVVAADPPGSGRWEVTGQLDAIDPEADLEVEIAFLTPKHMSLKDRPAESFVRTRLDDNGRFEVHFDEESLTGTAESETKPAQFAATTPALPDATEVICAEVQSYDYDTFKSLDNQFYSPGEPKVEAKVDTKPGPFALLRFPACCRDDGTSAPISAYLTFDQAEYVLFDNTLTLAPLAPWVTSKEALRGRARPPVPRGRRAVRPSHPPLPPDFGSPKDPLQFKDLWVDLSAWEGVMPHMYKDHKGLITVGAGNLLNRLNKEGAEDLMAAKGLPFKNLDTNKPATEKEIERDWERVSIMAAAMPAREYAGRPYIGLDDSYIRELAEKRFTRDFLPTLKSDYEGWDELPLAARRGLTEMIYALGPVGLKEFTTFNAKVAERNWKEAAANCRIKSGRETRNEWRKQLFLYAAKVQSHS